MFWFVTLSTTSLHCLTEQLFVLGFHIVDSYCLRFDKRVVRVVVVGHDFDTYCLRFDRVQVYVVVVGYIVDHYCLMFDCGLICVVSNCSVVDFCLILLHFMEKLKFHFGGNPNTRTKSSIFCKFISQSIT